jgi:sialic acid synthase SpsE
MMTNEDTNFYVGNHHLNKDPCYIIAEIGSNHDGNKDRAFLMVQLAAKAGANAIKFQLFQANKIAANVDLPETRINDQFSKFGQTVFDLYKNLELPLSWLKELKACCDENKIHFLATPFDESSADVIAELGAPAMKVASFEITHIPLLKHLGRLQLPILLSTGMTNLGEIETAIDTIQMAGEDRIALFHCGIEYPAPFDSVNLRSMETLRLAFQCPVGYSDHTQGIAVSIAAIALGAVLYEKHVTLAGGKSPDHDFALEMDEFEKMVQYIRECETALGDTKKKVQESELKHLMRGRRSIFVVKDMKKNEIFTRENLAVLRPGIGIVPALYEEILGRKSTKNLKAINLLKNGDWQ